MEASDSKFHTNLKRGWCNLDVPPIIWTSELLGDISIVKVNSSTKLEIYARRKASYTSSQLSLEYWINESDISYLCRFIDHHRPDILRQDKNRYYSHSPELKVQIINRVLIDHRSIPLPSNMGFLTIVCCMPGSVPTKTLDMLS